METTRIKILPDEVANRIAAGEVIERPASVVKELIENSIDAESRLIRVDVSEGGLGIIRVMDDGYGMGRDDALLAFERHATSKLSSEEELMRLQTLGFRGEALPSIASISKIRMVTQKKGDPVGYEVKLEGGNFKNIREFGAPQGTLIEVEDLFYNTPARRKFLKSSTTEIGHISRLILQHALAYPSLHFQLSVIGQKSRRELYDLTPVDHVGDRLLQVYGEEFSSHLIPVEWQRDSLNIKGYISRPLFTRAERNHQELFVNRRPVRNPSIRHAVYEAYQTLITRGRHPVTYLFLECDPSLIDVNVHPSKQEIRFRENRVVHDSVQKALRDALMGQEHAVSSSFMDPIPENTRALNEGERGSLEKGLLEVPSYSTRIQEATERYFNRTPVERGSFVERDSPAVLSGELPHIPEKHPRLLKEEWSPIAQIHDTFILAVAERDLFFVDQHTAHERVLFEKILKSPQCLHQESQQLLLPLTLQLSVQEFLLLKEHGKELNEIGITMEPFGENTMIIRSVPAMIQKGDYRQLLLDLIDDLVVKDSLKTPEIRHRKVVATLACHSAVRANRPMKKEEMSSLLSDLQKTDLPFTCPHGRPTMMKLEGRTLERLFWR